MGSHWVELMEGPIPAGRVREFIRGDPRWGGVVTFEGVTRDETDAEHGRLARLEYEAHRSMAERQLLRLVSEAATRFGVRRVAIVHRLGPVTPGEASVMIAVACEHRAEAFDACRWIMDSLKKDVPIWKKDVFEDGHVTWVEPGIVD